MSDPDRTSQPPTAPLDEGQIQVLVDYLNQHRDQINIAALRKQLIQAGHPQALVDEAVQRVNPSAQAGAGNALGTFGLVIIFSIANLMFLPLISFALNDLVIRLIPDFGRLLWGPFLFISSVIILPLIIQIVIGARMSNGQTGIIGKGLLLGAAIPLGIFGVIVFLFGVCFAVLGLFEATIL
ncbi:MAG: hypothetical protein AB4911_03035 [Oscillochloridaceae bacterium umkhey_bin13]